MTIALIAVGIAGLLISQGIVLARVFKPGLTYRPWKAVLPVALGIIVITWLPLVSVTWTSYQTNRGHELAYDAFVEQRGELPFSLQRVDYYDSAYAFIYENEGERHVTVRLGEGNWVDFIVPDVPVGGSNGQQETPE